MGTSKKNQFDFSNYKWSKPDLVRGDHDTSFKCPSCEARSFFSHEEASHKNPKTTGQLQPMGYSARLTNGIALFFNQIYDRQPLIRALSIMIGIATVIFLIWFWRQTIYEGGSVPWYIGALALFGGWAVTRLVQPAMSPRLSLWRFNCPECGAEYVLATNGTQARIGDNKGRIDNSSIPGNQTRFPAEKGPELKIAKAPEPELPPLRVSRKAVKAMAEKHDVEQLVQVAKRGGVIAQLKAGKALLELDEVRGLDALLNETDLAKYYEQAVSHLESHRSEPRAIEALRRAISHEVELNITRFTTPDARELNKLRSIAAAKALDRLGIAHEVSYE